MLLNNTEKKLHNVTIRLGRKTFVVSLSNSSQERSPMKPATFLLATPSLRE